MTSQGEFSSGAVLTSTDLNTFSQVTVLEESFTIPQNTNYTLSFGAGSETIDVGGWHSTTTNTNRITVPYAGVYVVNVSVYDLISDDRALLKVYQDGTEVGAFDSATGGGGFNDFTFTRYVVAAANDYFNLELFHNSSGAKTADIAFTVHLIRRTS
jgi:hypothetical protein